MSKIAWVEAILLALTISADRGLAADQTGDAAPKIMVLDPPEQNFFTKEIRWRGIPVKAPAVVTNTAMFVACDRLSRELQHLPQVTSNLAAAGVEVHIIGQHQVTSDLPEYQDLKGKPLPEYQGKTIDE
jgi:hypothetical protein